MVHSESPSHFCTRRHCPTIVSTMQSIEKKLSEDEKQDVGFILVSLTPDTDTPEVMRESAQKRNLI